MKCPRCGDTFESDAQFCPNDGVALEPSAKPAVDPYIGKTVSGDIELTRILGVGAMGRVYRGHQSSIGRDVAVKVLHPELSANLQLMQRFQREAKFASKLQHAHVVEVYLAGELPDGALYIVMEYLDGVSLAAALEAAGGAMPLPRAIGIALQMSDAVGEAHARGIVHRDLKPENVMLVRRGDTADWVKVLDFGIAKGMQGAQSIETAVGQIFGTPRYMSPEGALGGAVGPASDVYSLATMVYQLLAGHTPFDAEQAVGLLIKHIHEPPPDLVKAAGSRNIPAGIARVVMENLAKDPAARAQNGHAFGRALATAAKSAGVVVPDDGAIARMSVADFRVVEPTLSDAPPITARLPAIASAHASMPNAPNDGAPNGAAASDMPRAGSAGVTPSNAAHADGEATDGGSTAPHSAGRDRDARKPRRAWLALGVMFVIGAGVAVAGETVARRGDTEHTAYVARTQKAYADRHFTSPKGENVHDLVAEGLARWPDDPALLDIRARAAQELIQRATTLRSGGDIEGALDGARKSLELTPTSYSTKLLVDQYEGELRSLDTDAGISTGSPRVLFHVQKAALPSSRIDLVAHVMTRGRGPKATVDGVKMSLRKTLTETGTVLPMTSGGGGVYTAHTEIAEEGRWYIVFEANVEGTLIRAERPIDVGIAPP